MKMKELQQLADIMDCHVTTVLRKLQGVRNFTKAEAKKLEEVTGLDRRSWLYPEEFNNPTIERYRKNNSRIKHVVKH